ncbi:MAG: leucyl/phenylalanyl-tRNA--protein transferase [Gelidibacter sp.]
MYYVTHKIEFPDVSLASKEGLLAIGGDLTANRLLLAYQRGIFPWFSDGEPILWWSPNPRFVLFPEKLKVSKSMTQMIRKHELTVTFNSAFEDVIHQCAKTKRSGQLGTWITTSMIDAYIALHKLGVAKSVEVWQENKLVGGLYGVDLGNGIFCGESMFSKVSNASKLALIWLVQNHDYKLIDCQVYTKHLESLGAENIPRHEFLNYL